MCGWPKATARLPKAPTLAVSLFLTPHRDDEGLQGHGLGAHWSILRPQINCRCPAGRRAREGREGDLVRLHHVLHPALEPEEGLTTAMRGETNVTTHCWGRRGACPMSQPARSRWRGRPPHPGTRMYPEVDPHPWLEVLRADPRSQKHVSSFKRDTQKER